MTDDLRAVDAGRAVNGECPSIPHAADGSDTGGAGGRLLPQPLDKLSIRHMAIFSL